MTKIEWKTDINTDTVNNDSDQNWLSLMNEAYEKWVKELEAGDPEAANFK